MNKDLTTNLERIRRAPMSFTWGNPVAFHDVGRYTIVEYIREGKDESEKAFHVYVDGRSTNNACSTLEKALILAIAFGSGQGINIAGHMAQAACRLLVPDFQDERVTGPLASP